MRLFSKIFEKIKSFKEPVISIYPLVVIILIPALLAINTIWNLKSFNRDANYLVRHQAISVADTLKPVIVSSLDDSTSLKQYLVSSANSNEDILLITLLKKDDKDFKIIASTSDESQDEVKELGLNQLALGFEQSFAGLTYDINLQKNVWNVVVPVETDSDTHLLYLKLDTQVVNEILERTSKDSFIVLAILILVTLILLANHFYFYTRSLKTKQLEELDKLKDEFISMATHELRAPMTALTGYLELLRGKISPEQLPAIQADLVTLDGITRDLHSLIDDLLNVSRLEQGRIQLKTEDIQVNDIVLKVIETMTPSANQKGLQIEFIKEDLPVIKSDPDRLKQILTNLTSNAIKYSLKGKISISAQAGSKVIKITVRDTGIGIPAEHLAKLFTKFHRVKDKQTNEERGTGLGLWITKKLVELLGGKIYAESIYGTGTSIIFTLPISIG